MFLKFYELFMLHLSRPERVYLYIGIVDFRKQMNGLSHLVDLEFPQGHLQDSWFVFISRNKKQVKILYWRGSGLALWQYRLEEERFQIPIPRPDNTYGISWKSLRRFLNGYNIFEGESHRRFLAKKYA